MFPVQYKKLAIRRPVRNAPLFTLYMQERSAGDIFYSILCSRCIQEGSPIGRPRKLGASASCQWCGLASQGLQDEGDWGDAQGTWRCLWVGGGIEKALI